MPLSELLSKIITETVTNEDFQAFTTSNLIMSNTLKGSRDILEQFGFKVSTSGTMFGPLEQWAFKYSLIPAGKKGYRLQIEAT